ncbi:MAG: hypothetical protein IGR76_13590, partial [Synechococcales cyanobacterium T60_A2020_003]|nr:hypothetical protein [Synechococcales cyanobacterium T60_A2020_003]
MVQFVDDPAARLAQLEAGAIDFTADLTPDQLPTNELPRRKRTGYQNQKRAS